MGLLSQECIFSVVALALVAMDVKRVDMAAAPGKVLLALGSTKIV